MSKLNKANNTSIFFDEILASFSPFILLVLDCSYKKPYILPPKVFILWRYFFTLYACLYSNQRKNAFVKM